jgi:hypothetical protein
MMFQARQSGNGEGLENRVFFCSGNLLNSLDLLTDEKGCRMTAFVGGVVSLA